MYFIYSQAGAVDHAIGVVVCEYDDEFEHMLIFAAYDWG